MDFRWKVPELKPNFVDPQGVRSTMAQQAAQKMQGYTPQPNLDGYQPTEPTAMQTGYRGMAPTQETQEKNAVLAQQNYDNYMSGLQEKKQKLALLENKLAEIDNNIAQLQQGGADEEKAIAAKLAEIGDTSLYQGILAREQNQAAQQKSSAAGIDNLLFEADKLIWGLDSDSEEGRKATRQNIRAMLDQAKKLAEQNGVELPEKYKMLRDKLEGSDNASIVYESVRTNYRELSNKMAVALERKGAIPDELREEAVKFVEEHPNSEEALKIQGLLQSTKGKTVSAKAAASKRKQDAEALFNSLKDLSLKEQLNRWNNMTKSEKNMLRSQGYDMDTRYGIYSKGGI